VRRLVRVGAALLVVQALIAPPLLLAAPETPPDIVAMERAILTEGGFFEAVLFRSIGFAFIMPSFLVIQGTAALGWFCLGLAAVKSGMIDDAVHPLWRRARRWCLGPGVALGLLGAAIWQWGPPVPGVVLTIVSAPVATLGYLGLIAAVSRPPGPIMAQALAAGGSSLSIYLGQSIILSTIFSGYGLGLWSAVDRLTAVLVALAVTGGLIGLLLIWRPISSSDPSNGSCDGSRMPVSGPDAWCSAGEATKAPVKNRSLAMKFAVIGAVRNRNSVIRSSWTEIWPVLA
jgi:uncharacterized protein